MRPSIFISAVLLFTTSCGQVSEVSHENASTAQTGACRTVLDSLTKTIIYLDVETAATNEGGAIELIRKYAKLKLDSIPDDYDTNFVIEFIVDTNGQISGERIIKDKIGSVGPQMIALVRTLKWIPAECKGSKVPSLVNLPLQMCLMNSE